MCSAPFGGKNLPESATLRAVKTIPWLLAALFASAAVAGTNVKLLLPATPVEGGELRVRYVGPFSQPAPALTLRIEGNRVIARSVGNDFAFPNLPAVAAVEAAIPAPPAGRYFLVDERCAGNPPPPQGPCVEVSSLGFTVVAAHSVPALSGWLVLVLAGLVAASARISASNGP
jgi:hypothetical protein